MRDLIIMDLHLGWRPNIIIDGCDTPFDEDGWEGYSVGPSGQIIYTVARCIRCMLPNVDPATGVRDAAVRFFLPEDVLYKVLKCFDPDSMDSHANFQSEGARCQFQLLLRQCVSCACYL